MEDTPPLVFDDLVAYLAKGCKPRENWRVGAEHELFAFNRRNLERLPYNGTPGITDLLHGLMQYGWQTVHEGDVLIGLTRDGAGVSLEPGGQFELSGAQHPDIHAIYNETQQYGEELHNVADDLNIGFLGVGFSPLWSREQTPVMPKGRYNIMRPYMAKVGRQGLDMMLRTCTIQTNLDYSSEANMVAKFRTSLALQPIVTALFANSPFTEGAPNGYLSKRANVWTETDPDRTGMPAMVFQKGFGFEAYTRYALGVPMYFVKRGHTYIDVSGASFADFMEGKLDILPGERPTLKDWADHLTTLFPDVRLKTYLEMRGADGGPQSHIAALAALWVGLLYEQDALSAAWSLCKDWSHEEMLQLRQDVAKGAMSAKIQNRTVHAIAKDMVDIAMHGLSRRRRMSAAGQDETRYLTPLMDIVDSGKTLAELQLDLYNGLWRHDISRLYQEWAA
ncbi:MAG: glutamate--cysteine ligase [Alphaproteobacteria bacterium]|nr:glutamate--cysteine ligase [Alphaproteobacteria bacterium]